VALTLDCNPDVVVRHLAPLAGLVNSRADRSATTDVSGPGRVVLIVARVAGIGTGRAEDLGSLSQFAPPLATALALFGVDRQPSSYPCSSGGASWSAHVDRGLTLTGERRVTDVATGRRVSL
jgi:hypothetical protein